MSTPHLITPENLRIISGSARGRRLFSPPGQNLSIRPTSDRAREALFNIIARHVVGATVLDLFAGTGALGLEAFSRGAEKVAFVDNDRLAIDLVARNILTCCRSDRDGKGNTQQADQAGGRFTLIRHDLRKGLPLNQFRQKSLYLFDLIFLDPPYSKGLCGKVLQDLDRDNVLSADGLLIAEESAKENIDHRFSTLELLDNRVYGETAFWLFRRKQPSILSPQTF